MTGASGDTGSIPPLESAGGWLEGGGSDNDVVVSSRVRLARNLAGYPFVWTASAADRGRIVGACHDVIVGAALAPQLMWIDLARAAELDRAVLVERRLISQQHARGRQAAGRGGADEPRAVAIGMPRERFSVMVNEEDHLRIQVVAPGLDLGSVASRANEIDDALEDKLDFAFSPRFGYLTACPTNVGTGARLSVMLHLPALKATNEVEKVKRAAADMSLAIRGAYGEGSESLGDFYQISNQTTLGKTELILLNELQHEIIPRVIEYERAARKRLLTRQRRMLEDKVFRALGTLRSARLMSTQEAMQQLSWLRLGVALGLIEDVDIATLNRLTLLTQPAHLQRVVGSPLNQDQRREARAALLRSRLAPA
ncbi:MAG: ATP--guanido phosphotransferase [Phycisphaerales bacterium JB039]